ncbi:MAG: putative iron-regulated membrane protein [Chlamydiales bacterium]|jgi:uncharacterized iron-regulated membrane protein
MTMWLPKLARRLHRWGAALVALPVVVILVTGVILQLKKDVDWVQPPTQYGTAVTPTLSFEQVLEIVRGVPESDIDTWDDVDRLDVRPGKGMLKVRAKNSWEVQIDSSTGEVLQVAYRRSDLIESIHDGSFFADAAKLWLFLPAGVILLGLWLTGVYLWLLPHIIRRKRLRRRARS